jgi:Zn-dependent protease with chaperone function
MGLHTVANLFPVVGNLAALAIQQGLLHWSRMAEFSCDRAALLVVQDRQVVASALAKLAGFQEKHVPDFNFDALLRQIDDYERYDENTLQAAAKLQRTLVMAASGRGATHPWPVLRVKRILDWGNSDHYRDILAGNYQRDTSTRPPPAQQAAGSPKCAQCGNFMPAGSTFCSYCGQRL